MPDVMIVSVPPYEGEYEFELGEKPLSPVEWRWLKKISGYLPLTIDQGWSGGDPDLFLAFAVIAMRRAGKIAKDDVLQVASELEEAPFDGTAITFRGEVTEEEDADPQPEETELEDSEPSTGDDSDRAYGDFPGDRDAEDFWHPALGHHFGLRPLDLADETMSIAHMMACAEWLEQVRRQK